jgi:hypothetical protein
VNLGRCSECKASIVWAETPAGKRIPLNPIPVVVARGDIATDDAAPVALMQAYQIHFSTCAKRDPRTRR